MNITELFKDAFKYSYSDLGKILILGTLIFAVMFSLFITVTSAIFGQYVITAILGAITVIFTLVTYLIYGGYSLSVIRDTIANKNVYSNNQKILLPEFAWSENIIDGLKVFILIFVYMLIPIILSLVVGVFSSVDEGIITWIQNPFVGSFFNYTSVNHASGLGFSIAIVNTIISILTIILSLFSIIAMGRLAETGRLRSIFEFSEIFNTISKIGWGNYIVWFIVLNVITNIIAIVSGVIIFIPIIGLIAYALIIPVFLVVFTSRAIGLIYNES